MERRQIYTYALLVLGLLLLYSLQGSFLGYQFKPFYGNPGGGVLGAGTYDVLDLYYAYPNWFDFFLFLVLFIGIGMGVIGDKFEGAGKSVYVAIGIMLALSLVIWEARTGFYILEILGPLIFLILAILLAILIFKWAKDLTGSAALGVALGLILFFIFFAGVLNNFGGGGYLILDFIYYSPLFALLLGLMNPIIVILFVVGITALLKRRS